jgi:DNA-binding transcriptional ArsR family regulator
MVAGCLVERERVDLLFHALSDATRRDIVTRALAGEYSVSGLARLYPMSVAAVQKHVAVLERADLITKHQRGRERIVRGRIDAVRDVNRLLDELEGIWHDRMQRFGDVLAEPDQGEHPCP